MAEYSFKGKGFWTVQEEVVPPVLTFRADPDPMLGDPDEIGIGPQDLDLSFTWDGPDDWLSKVAGKDEDKEPVGTMTTPCKEVVIPLPQEAMEPPDGPLPELILAPVNVEGPEESLLDGAP